MQSSNVVALNPFRQWSMHGYKELIPIIPPAAELSENSYIRKNKSQGKAPGIRYPSGQWGGLPGWREVAASESDIDDWHAMGAGVGLRRGAAFMLDIDATDEAVADGIEAAAIAALGDAPMRVGRWPKRALLYRADGPIDGGKLIFEGPDGAPNQIELPAQMVVFGIHPVTGKPYEWRRKPVAFDELTGVTQEKLDAFLEAQRRLLPKAKRETGAAASDRAAIDQGSLTGRSEHVKAAIAALPNTRDTFPTYDSMILIGNALHAALPDDPGLANELWHEWCARWEGGDYSAELTDKRWDTLQTPHTVGAKYIYSKAVEHGDFDMAPVWHEEIPVSVEEALSFPDEKPRTDVFEMLSIADILSRETPKFLIDRHVPEQSVGFLYGDPGTGKSFIALDWALHLAYQSPAWHGDEIEPNAGSTVVYLAGEGVSGYKTRISAWLAQHNEVRGDDRFRLVHQSMNLMSNEDGEKLVRTLRSVGGPISMIVVDTVSRTIAGSEENSTKEMSVFVDACTRVSKAFDCAVVGIHHTNKTGGMRGSTTFPGGADFVFKLERKKGSNIGWLFCEKQKDAPDGWGDNYKFDVVCTGVNAKGKVVSSWVPTRCTDDAIVEAATRQDGMLDALERAWSEGRPWGLSHQSGSRYAPRNMARHFDISAEDARSLINTWLRSGVVYEDVVSANSKQKGLRKRHTFEEENDENGQSVFD